MCVAVLTVVEWLEANLLGWKIPGDEDMMPVYKQLALYYPEEHAYTFDSYRSVAAPASAVLDTAHC